MAIAIGTRLGPYEVTGMIGAGGMGQVYRARDSRLGRDVAIKTSTVAFDDRFQREARAIAALNHPNVCTLHDIGPDYLVLEYVEGRTLADRIAEGAVPETEALAIAHQIAAALAAAHEKGIVHRDLKPANVKVTPDGQVKVLDFGLAKASEAEQAPVTVSDLANSPTMASPARTEQGLILGTAGYMAPEQARGQMVDRRADIWDFGVVLWEMLTGRRLFVGDTTSDLVAAVLREEPRWDDVPPSFRPLLRRCLEKDPRRRLHDIADAQLWLEDVPAPVAPALVSAPSVKRSFVRWVLPVAAGLVAASLGWFGRGQRAEPSGASLRLSFSTPAGVGLSDIISSTGAALSADGQAFVYMARDASYNDRLFVYSFSSGTSQVVPGTEGAVSPAWSPDGRSLAFTTTGRRLKQIPLAGGAATDLGEVPTDAHIGSWSDGFVILGSRDGVFRFPESGGAGEALTRVDASRGEFAHGAPQLVGDGRHFIYFVQDATLTGAIHLGTLGVPGERRRLVQSPGRGVFLANGPRGQPALLYLRDTTLVAHELDLTQGALVGEPVDIASSVAISAGNLQGLAPFWVTPPGLLVFRQPRAEVAVPLVWVDRQGKRSAAVAPPPSGQLSSFFLSPDDRRLSADVRDANGLHDVWIYDFLRGIWERTVSGPANDFLGVWSPLGDRLVFGSSRTGTAQLYVARPGSMAQERISEGPDRKYPLQWSRDLVLFRALDAAHPAGSLWAMPVEGVRKPYPVVQDASTQFSGQVSPDGRWLAFSSNRSGASEIYVQRFGGDGSALQLSNGGGRWPKWRADGRELFYVSAQDVMMAVALAPSGEALVPSAPKELFRTSLDIALTNPYEVSRDGLRFLVLERLISSGQFDVITNWRVALQDRR